MVPRYAHHHYYLNSMMPDVDWSTGYALYEYMVNIKRVLLNSLRNTQTGGF